MRSASVSSSLSCKEMSQFATQVTTDLLGASLFGLMAYCAFLGEDSDAWKDNQDMLGYLAASLLLAAGGVGFAKMGLRCDADNIHYMGGGETCRVRATVTLPELLRLTTGATAVFLLANYDNPLTLQASEAIAMYTQLVVQPFFQAVENGARCCSYAVQGQVEPHFYTTRNEHIYRSSTVINFFANLAQVVVFSMLLGSTVSNPDQGAGPMAAGDATMQPTVNGMLATMAGLYLLCAGLRILSVQLPDRRRPAAGDRDNDAARGAGMEAKNAESSEPNLNLEVNRAEDLVARERRQLVEQQQRLSSATARRDAAIRRQQYVRNHNRLVSELEQQRQEELREHLLSIDADTNAAADTKDAAFDADIDTANDADDVHSESEVGLEAGRIRRTSSASSIFTIVGHDEGATKVAKGDTQESKRDDQSSSRSSSPSFGIP